MKRPLVLRLELFISFGLIPILILLVKERALMVGLLWVLGAACWVILQRGYGRVHRTEWNWPGARAGLKDILPRFLMLAPMLILFTWLYAPERLFSFPLERPPVWLMVMVLYPVLSVWPQEIIFRSYFLTRFAPLFKNETHLALASAAAFGYVHIVFMNWIAILFCTVGGWLFAQTYLKHRSLALVCIEHALYGCWIFTVGLGWYFYGAAWQR